MSDSRLKSSLLTKPTTTGVAAVENKLLRSSVLTSSSLTSSTSLLSTQKTSLASLTSTTTPPSFGLTSSFTAGKTTSSLASTSRLSSFSNLQGLDRKTTAPAAEDAKKLKPAESVPTSQSTQSKLLLITGGLAASEKPLVQSIGHLSLNGSAVQTQNLASMYTSNSKALESGSTKSALLAPVANVAHHAKLVKTNFGEKRQYEELRSQESVVSTSTTIFTHEYTDEFEELVSKSIMSKIDKENRSEEDSAKAKRYRRNQYLKQVSQAVAKPDPRTDATTFKRAMALSLVAQKNILINAVSSSLLNQPNFKNKNDPTRNLIMECAETIARMDPQFVLKLALYTRRELNIRVTANFLLCLASFKENCRPFLHRYFKHSIVLPSDWIDVAEQYQLFTDKHINFGSLPSALRKCMVDKFPDFDQYQLAKYNKEKSRMGQQAKLKDIKHVKSKIRESDGDHGDAKSAVTAADSKLIESKYIKTVSKGLKLNDKIIFEVVAEATCPLLKFDIVQKQEVKKVERSKQRVGFRAATVEKNEVDESVAVRFGVDFAYQRITMKSYLNKTWTKKPEVLNDTKSFDLARGPTPKFYFIEVKADRFVFGLINKRDESVVRMTSYLHSKHNIEMFKLNTIRISGVDIKLKDVQVESKDKVVEAEENKEESDEKELKQRSFTLKQLIRQLHIAKPVENVMALIGKKYPLTFEDFMQSKLPGLFDSERAGKRMKLPIPETWETQISMKGNKPEVWESLIDNKKLPYMAMLRNLRNMITVGISEKHHQWVIKKLQDEGAVIHSKQFPFRFFSAYEVLDELEEELKKYQEWSQGGQAAAATAPKPPPSRDNRKKQSKRQKETEKFSDMKYDETLIKRYKTALDNALKVATTFNINPIKGSTAIVLFSDFQSTRVAPNRSLGRKPRHASELGSLLALMFKYSCEFSKLNVYRGGTSYKDIDLEQGTILDNMSSLLKLSSRGSSNIREGTAYPRKLFSEMLLEKEHYDNIIIIGEKVEDTEFQREFLRKYRTDINENLLFVFVNVGASECSLVKSVEFDHQNDVCIAGFSDAILRFVAERGNQGQLVHIEHIDKSYELPDLRKNAMQLSRMASKTSQGEEAMDWEPSDQEAAKTQQDNLERNVLPLMIPVSQWKTLKVFISSTFRDMHSERDVLSKIVFPMLRAKLNPFLVNVYEIDMRWGITESQANENKTLEICLSQILGADYFVGMIGDRYGQTLTEYKFKNDHRLAWLKSYPPGASITELETECQMRKFGDEKNKNERYERSFFFFRNNSSFINEVPAEYRDQFESENSLAKASVDALKQRIKREPFEIYDGYRAKWYRMDENHQVGAKRALLTDLDSFAERVFKNLFNAILNHQKLDANSTLNTLEQLAQADEMSHLTNLNRAFVEVCSQSFVGRHKLLTAFTRLIKENQLVPILNSTTESAKELIKKQNSVANIVLVSGEAGSGKTAFVCNYFEDYYFQIAPAEELNLSNRFMHCVGAFKGSDNIMLFLKRFCVIVNRNYQLGNSEAEMKASNDLGFFKGMFAKLLQQLNDLIVTEKFYVIIDSVDQFLDNTGAPDLSFSWLPVDNMPSRIFFILSARSTSPVKNILGKVVNSNRDMQNPIKLSVFEIESLDVLDKGELVRLQLGKYNKYLDETPFNNQMKLLTGKRDSLNPLYLALACEELRTHNQFETLSAKIKEMPIKISLLLDYVLDRLETEFGKNYVRAAFLFICSSKDGLIEFELKRLIEIYFQAEKLGLTSDLVHLNAAAMDDTTGMLINLMKNSAKNVSEQATTAKFLSFLDSISKTFLNPRSSEESSSIISIRPQELIAAALRNRYGTVKLTKAASAASSGLLSEQQAHKLMALFYWDSIDNEFERSWAKASNERAFLNLPFHLAMSDAYADLLHVICDLNFIYKKCQLGLAYSLMNDFDLHEQFKDQSILRGDQSDSKQRSASSLTFFNSSSRADSSKNDKLQHPVLNTDKFQDYKKFVTTSYHLLQSNPKITYQQAMNEPNHSWPSKDLRALLKSGKSNVCGSFFEWANKPQDKAVTSLLPTTINDFSTAVCSVAISPDGQRVACGTENCDVRFYQLATAALIRTFQGHSGRINQLCFVNSDVLCSASFDGIASLWNVNDGYRIKTLNKHNGHSVSGCCAEPNGKSVVTVGWDCTGKIWNAANGNLEGELKGHDRPISCVAFNPEGNLVATGCWDSCVRIFNLHDRARKAVLRGHKSSVRTLAYSHTGTYIASASIDGEVKLWNAKNGTTIATLNGHSMPVNFVKFSPNNQFLVTGSSDRCVKIWTGHIGKIISVIKDDETASPSQSQAQAAESSVTAVAFKQSTGNVIAAGHHSGEIKFYETYGGQLKSKLKVHSSPVKRIKFTAFGKHLVSTAEDGTIRIVKVDNLSEPTIVAELEASNRPVNALTISRYNTIIVGSDDCLLRVYSNPIGQIDDPDEPDDEIMDLFDVTPKSRPAKQVSVAGKAKPSGLTRIKCDLTLSQHQAPITACAFDADGQQFASCSKDATIIIWKMNAKEWQEHLRINNAHLDWITDLQWSNSSDFILTASNDLTLKIWSANDGKERSVLTGHTSNISSCAFQYGCVVSTSCDGSIKIWSHKGHEISTLLGHQNKVNACDLWIKIKSKQSAKKDQEVAADDGGMSLGSLWADRVEEEEWLVEHKKAKMNKQDYTIEQVYLVTASEDSTVRLWKPIDSDYLVSLEKHNDKINALDLSKYGTLATASADKSVNAWDLKPFFDQVLSGSLVSKERVIQNHNSEITSMCSSSSKGIILSSSRDGLVIAWQYTFTETISKTGHKTRTFDGFKFLVELQAHYQTCYQVCIVDDSKADRLVFATASTDRNVKTWRLNLTPEPKSPHGTAVSPVAYASGAISSIEIINLGGPVVFLQAVAHKSQNNKFLLAVDCDSTRMRINSIKLTDKFTKSGNITCSVVSHFSGILQKIKLVNERLYVTLLHDKIIRIDVTGLITRAESFIYQPSQGAKVVNTMKVRLFDSSDLTEILKKNSWNALWYSTVEEQEDSTIIAGDHRGTLHVSLPIPVVVSSAADNSEQPVKMNKLDQIHDDRITELLTFKTKSSEARIISASQDGSVKVWSQLAESKLGQFNLRSGISCMAKLDAADANATNQLDQFCFLIGDQMGNLNLIKWYEDVDNDAE